MIQLGYLLTLEYEEVHVIFIPLDVQKLSPLENTEIGTALIPHVHGKLSRSSLVIIYMCKKVSDYHSHSFTYLPIFFHPPPPYDIYYQQISEILSN